MIQYVLKMFIRMATTKDSERLAQLTHELNLQHAPYHPMYKLREDSFACTLAYVKDAIEKSALGEGLVLLAQGKEIIGFLTCVIQEVSGQQWENRRIGHLGLVYVIPAYRRQGVAAALMKEALAWMKNRGAKYVSLDVDDRNRDAMAAWIAMGFKPHRHNLVHET